MPSFDAATGEVVVRIAYDGLGTAGKTTNLRSLHAAFTERAPAGLETFDENAAGRTLFFDWLELRAGHVDAWPLRCQVVSVPGQFVHAHRRFQLLHGIDAVVLVCDSTPRGVEAGAIAMSFLVRVLDGSARRDLPIVLQANKQDLPGALTPEQVAARMPFAPAAVVPASATSGDGVRLTLLRALDLVRHDVRARLERVSPATFEPVRGSARALYEALSTSDGSHGPALDEALDLALEQVK